MSRMIALRRLTFAALATLGIAFACRATPGEAPPLAPRPEPTEPSTNPVPGAPDPLDPVDPSTPGPNFPPEDAGIPGVPPTAESRGQGAVSAVPRPVYRAQASDAGVEDAGDAGAGGEEPPPDALDPGDPPGPDDAGLLPPVADAELPDQPSEGGGPFQP